MVSQLRPRNVLGTSAISSVWGAIADKLEEPRQDPADPWSGVRDAIRDALAAILEHRLAGNALPGAPKLAAAGSDLKTRLSNQLKDRSSEILRGAVSTGWRFTVA